VTAGGQISSVGGYLGYCPGASGVATISGSGSQWTNSNCLYVGYSGSGTLNVASGSQVTSSYGYLGLKQANPDGFA
jgi:T5SS/PEP-CTERM-associated repeat protein